MSVTLDDLHFHIRWSTVDTMDWERFPTRKAAEERARELVGPDEDYVIEVRGETCERCASLGGAFIAPAPPRPAHSAKRNQSKTNEKR